MPNLILRRKLGESVIIITPEGEIEVTYTKLFDGKEIQLAFEAPRAIKVLRKELKTIIVSQTA